MYPPYTGYFPDEIVQLLQLPPHLKNHPYLVQVYGTLKWSVKGVFTNYMGWFSGRAYELDPLSQKEESQEILNLVGGNPTSVYEQAEKALKHHKVKWALKLCDILLETENLISEAKSLKAQCLEILAEEQTSFGGRNWLLTAAMELRGDLVIKPTKELVKEKIYATSLFDLFQRMSTMLDAENTFNVTEEAHFHITDANKYFILKVKPKIKFLKFHGV